MEPAAVHKVRPCWAKLPPALMLSVILAGCGSKPFSKPVSGTVLAELGQAGTVKVFALGDITAQAPSQISVEYASVNVSDPSSLTGQSNVQRRVIDNAFAAAQSQGLIASDISQSDWEWEELAKHPDQYLHIDQTSPSTIPNTFAYEGSGTVVSADGLILTNSHVVSDAGNPQDISPDLNIFGKLISLLTRDLGPLPSDPKKAQKVQLSLLSWILKNTNETFSFKSARVYLDDHSDTIDQQEKDALAASKSDPTAMDEFEKSITVPAQILQKGTPWPGDDVAILKVDASHLIALPLGDASTVAPGEPVACFGYPGAAVVQGMAAGDEFRVIQKTGTVGQSMPMQSGYSAYNISADINHGNSGGPVLNQYGEVIGLGTAGNPQDNGENYAVPIELIKSYLNKAEANVELGDDTNLWYRGLQDFAAGKKVAALKEFQQIAIDQGATQGSSVYPGSVNRYVVELIHRLQSPNGS